jgi:hypothetical protein
MEITERQKRAGRKVIKVAQLMRLVVREAVRVRAPSICVLPNAGKNSGRELGEASLNQVASPFRLPIAGRGTGQDRHPLERKAHNTPG